MATYQETVLADAPVLYYRLDMTGASANGDVIPDSSGFGKDGELLWEPTPFSGGIPPTPNPYGYPSPIETDAASREFYAYTNAFPDTTGTSLIRFPTDGDLEQTGDAAVEDWIRPLTGMFSAADIPLCGTDDIGIQWADSGGQRFAAYCVDSAGTRWLAIDTSFDFTDFLGRSFYLVAVRVGNAINLYVDGVLKATTNISSALPTRTSGGNFNVGHPSGLHFHRSRHDEAAFYDHALTSGRVLAHYEAALNATLLRGYSNVIPTAVLRSDEVVTPISFPFRHNWDNPLIERIMFRSNLSRSRTGLEEGGQVRPKPRREIEISQMLRENSERQAFRAKLWAHQNKLWFVPMLEDRERLAAPLVAATTIPVTTTYRDYEVGGYVGVRQLNGSGRAVKSEIATISDLSGSLITLESALSNDYAANVTEIYPVKRAYLSPSQSITGHTDAVETLTVIARLIPEDEPTVPRRLTVWHPTIKYRDIEVFAGWTSNNWDDTRDYQIDREQVDIDFGDGTFSVDTDTPGATETFTYRFWIKGRADIAAFIGWFYERLGSLIPVWVPTMQRDFEGLGVHTGFRLTAEGTNYSDNYALAEARRDLAFVYNNGDMVFRRVVGFDPQTDYEILTLDAVVPSLSNLRSLSLLKLCRLSGDTLEIAKVTDDVWQFSLRFRELLETPEGVGVSSLSPSMSASFSSSPSGSQSPSASASPSRSASPSHSTSPSQSPSGSTSPSTSTSPSRSPSGSTSPSSSVSPSV